MGLKNDSATGPDELPTRILTECAKQLAEPFCMLAKLILAQGRWPELWMEHWIVPLHKRNSVFKGANYRGVHLTAQASKTMERILLSLFMPYVVKHGSFGPNQFAYTPERGARDAIAYGVLDWITALARGFKVDLCCSDVSGAFDRVDRNCLIEKLKVAKVHPALVAVFALSRKALIA